MTTRLFGTDGIRARAGEWPLTPEFTLRLGRSIGMAARARSDQPVVVIGRDTRRSGSMLESALISGMLAEGVDVVTLEEFTTPGISFLAAHLAATFGVVVSASHNPFWDNGVKVFEGVGFKASDELEQQIEETAQNGMPPRAYRRPAGDGARQPRPGSGLRAPSDPGIRRRGCAQGAAGGAGLRQRRGLLPGARRLSPHGRRGDRVERLAQRRQHQRPLRHRGRRPAASRAGRDGG